MVKISQDFIHRAGPYDVIFRCRIGSDYQYIHGFGQWQSMPDGTELPVINYLNVTKTKEEMVTVTETYDLFRKDLFYTDPLTGLPNLNYLHEFGDERVRVLRVLKKAPVVIFTDVYSMQSYNNQYGVQEGDELLRLVAASLKGEFPEALLIRGANDHFILVTELESREKLTLGLEQANQRIKKEAKGITSGIRAGICAVREGQNATEALDHARHALRRINNDMTRTWAFFSQEADDRYWKERYISENFEKIFATIEEIKKDKEVKNIRNNNNPPISPLGDGESEKPKKNTDSLPPKEAQEKINEIIDNSELSTPVKEKLKEFVEYKRSEIKKPYKSPKRFQSTDLKQTIKTEKEYGADATISCIDDCMGHGYQGLFFNNAGKYSKQGGEKKGFNATEFLRRYEE